VTCGCGSRKRGLGEAQAAARAGLALNLRFTIPRLRATDPKSANDPRREGLINGLRKAGVLEE
jgi:hypothetical protein